jgi:hypothetical protein
VPISNKSLSYDQAKEYAEIIRQAYDGVLPAIGINPHSIIPKDKKLSSGKDIKSIFPLTFSTMKTHTVEEEP